MALIEAFLIFSILFILSVAAVVVVSRAVYGLIRLVFASAGHTTFAAPRRAISAAPLVVERRPHSSAWKPVAYSRTSSGFRVAH